MIESQSKFWQITAWVLGIVLSALLGYYLSIKQRKPTFLTDKVTLLIDNNSIKQNPIKIIDSEGKEINENVSILTFYFFNQGRESIKGESILKPVRIMLPDSGRLLNLKMLKVTRDVTESKLTYDSLSNCINVDFKILENDDGFSAQILFAGKDNPEIKIEGIIEGVSDFILEDSHRLRFMLLGFGVLFLWVMQMVVTNRIRDQLERDSKKNVTLLRILRVIIFIAIVFWYFYFEFGLNKFGLPDSLM